MSRSHGSMLHSAHQFAKDLLCMIVLEVRKGHMTVSCVSGGLGPKLIDDAVHVEIALETAVSV